MRWPAVAVVLIALAALGPVAPVTAAPEDGPTPWLGVTYKPNPWGAVLITEVHPGGPAASAGLRSGDMLHALDGTPILDLGEQIRAAGLGARIRLTLERDGRAVVLRVRLAARPSPDELVHLALHGRALPRLPAVDGVGQPVRALAVRGAPTAVALFDARCAPCAAQVNRLASSLPIGAPRVRAVVLADSAEEFAALRAVTPMAASLAWVARPVAAGLISTLDPTVDGALIVVDGGGVIRFAAAVGSDAAIDGAAHAVANLIAAR